MRARIVFFLVMVAGLYALPVTSMEVFRPGFGSGFLSLLFLLLFLVLATAAFVSLLRHHRDGPKWAVWGTALLFVAWFPACASGSLGALGDRLYFERRETALRDLVARIERHDSVVSMSDGRRHSKAINGVYYWGPGSNPDSAIPLDVALDSVGVAVEVYDDIRRRMIGAGIVRFSTYDGRMAFVIDGFLDNYSGLLYVPRGPAPQYGEYAPEGEIIALTRVAPDWWVYATT